MYGYIHLIFEAKSAGFDSRMYETEDEYDYDLFKTEVKRAGRFKPSFFPSNKGEVAYHKPGLLISCTGFAIEPFTKTLTVNQWPEKFVVHEARIHYWVSVSRTDLGRLQNGIKKIKDPDGNEIVFMIVPDPSKTDSSRRKIKIIGRHLKDWSLLRQTLFGILEGTLEPDAPWVI